MGDFGGIELVFPQEVFGIEHRDIYVDERRVTNHKGGIVTEYDLGNAGVRGETFAATIHTTAGAVQCLTFARGEECVLQAMTEKDLRDYCTWAILNVRRGVLYLKWNRKQGAKKTLVCATYWAGG